MATAPEGWPEPPKPEVPEGWEWVWKAWHRLSSDRPYLGGGMSAPIPKRIAWREIVEWCAFHDLAGEDVDTMDRCFAEMDALFIAWSTGKLPPVEEPEPEE